MKNSFILFLAFSCATKDDDTKAAVNLKINECFDKFQNPVRLCLDFVCNDSRCPTGLVCVWECNVSATFVLTKNQNKYRFNLHLIDKFKTDTILDGIDIKLLNISSQPKAD